MNDRRVTAPVRAPRRSPTTGRTGRPRRCRPRSPAGVAWQSASTTSEKSKSVGIDGPRPAGVHAGLAKDRPVRDRRRVLAVRELVDDLEVGWVGDQDLERRAVGDPERGDAVALVGIGGGAAGDGDEGDEAEGGDSGGASAIDTDVSSGP